MPKNNALKKVMVIGSGPIIIGQAAEFDYAGTQACTALKEEKIEVVLVNSNPATIMTDDTIADHVYIQPLTLESLTYIIEKERPDGLIATLGGQTGLNMAIELDEAGVLEKNNVKVLGTSLEGIKKAEDRESFKNLMKEIGEPVPNSKIVSEMSEGISFANDIGYPVIVRPAYTLGGTGGGIASNSEELKKILRTGFIHSRINQVLIEQSIAGWKEIEYEVMRDENDTCIVICNMENVDPVGIHTGDSIVVAPSQTLSDKEYHMLRSASIRIIKALKIEGGCNVQLALNPVNSEYAVIEVNPRVSRSSALASKAAGYPIAKIATKIAIGMHLHEITNYVTNKTKASFEPTLDYIVTKIPKWPFDKFPYADNTLGTQMKATGEVMAIDRCFESSLLKAIACLENGDIGARRDYLIKLTKDDMFKKLSICNTERLFVVFEALRKGISIEDIYTITKIDPWFLNKFKNIVNIENSLKHEKLDADLLRKANKKGFTNIEIQKLTNKSYEELDAIRRANDIHPVYKMVDTCAGEFESKTPYYYSTYEAEDENIISKKEKVIVLGSGPIRIGQGIEFDYCSVQAVWAIKKYGYESIIINNNPETVSTDFDIADKLYFEPLFIDDVYNIIKEEGAKGVVVQFGGQTAINLAPKLLKLGVQILGTSVDSVDVAENRKRFEYLLRELNISQPKGIAVRTISEAIDAANKIEFPVLVRPSYVIGGRSMQIVYNEHELKSYVEEEVFLSPEHPILIDEYIEGVEVEIDAISDNKDVLIPGIMEHIERSGVHSGDSICVYPPQSLSNEVIDTLVDYTKRISKALDIKGLINIQFVVKDEEVYIVEVNPRASRTIPIMSKVTNVPMVDIAVNVILGENLRDMGFGTGLLNTSNLVAVKAPVFSFQKLNNVDVALSPEMKSTGEVLGVDNCYEKALTKALIAASYSFPEKGEIYVSLNERDKADAVLLIKEFKKFGFNLIAGEGTHRALSDNGLKVSCIDKSNIDLIEEKIKAKIKAKNICMIINTPTIGKKPQRDGFKIRMMAEQYNIPCFTSLDTAWAYLKALKEIRSNEKLTYEKMEYYK